MNATIPDKEGKAEVLDSKDKSTYFDITLKAFSSKEPEFTKEEAKAILERVSKVYKSPLIYGRIAIALGEK